MKKILFLVSALIVSSNVVWGDSVIPVTLDNKNYRPIGAGFDDRKSEFRGDCVEVTGIDSPERHMPSGTMNLKLEASQESLASKLGLSIGGRYRTGVTTTTASAEYLNESKSNGYSISYNYISEDSYQEYAENSTSHPIKARPGIEGYLKDSRTFYQNCGSEYVYARTLAARLFVTMKISFVSKAEKKRFAAEFGVDSPAFSLKGSLEDSHENYSSSNQISIRVAQQGGDPSKKGRILCPTQANGQPDPECVRSARNVVNCSFGDLKPCLEVIANVIAYANAQDGDNFPKQIENGKNYWVSELSTRPFVYIGTQFPPVPPKSKEDTFQAEVSTLSSLFEEEYEKWSYSHQLAFGKVPRLSDRQREEMNLLEGTFLRNLKRISTGIENCYQYGYTKCSGELEDVRSNLLTPQRATMAQIEALTLPEVFVQWCDLADSDHPELQTTIQTLKNYLLERKLIDKGELSKGDQCVKLDDRLKSIRDLDLSDPTYKISDLRPIGTLFGLRSLQLRGKKITSLAALKNLKELEVLDISDNEVSDLSTLNGMKSLRVFVVQNNKVKSLEILRGHPSLNEIDARGNGVLTCPLEDPTGCKILNFNDKTTISLLSSTDCSTMRIGSSAAPIGGGRVLVSGGFSGDGITIYKGSMEIRARDKCSIIANLNTGRANHTSTQLKDGRVLIVGGYTDTIEIVDPVQLLPKMLPEKMLTSRARHTATLLPDGRVVLIGGTSSTMDYAIPLPTPIAQVEIFDPTTNKLALLGNLEVPRMDHSATLLSDGRILVVGGYQMGQMLNTAEIVDPKLGTVERLDSALHLGRSGHVAELLLDGRVLIAGGYQWQLSQTGSGIGQNMMQGLDSLEIYDPKIDEFTKLKDKLQYKRGRLASVGLPDGRVMLIGGDSEYAPFDSLNLAPKSAQSAIELFDPVTSGIYSAGKLVFPRFQFSLAPLTKRSWLVIGGMGAGQSYSSAELIVYRP